MVTCDRLQEKCRVHGFTVSRLLFCPEANEDKRSDMMKAAFEVLKDRVRIPVILTRDSVCAGDDSDAPHEKLAEEHSFLDPAAFAQAVSSGYLPSVAGVGHTWICLLNGVRIAEISHSGVRPLVQTTPFATTNKVHFVYHSATY